MYFQVYCAYLVPPKADIVRAVAWIYTYFVQFRYSEQYAGMLGDDEELSNFQLHAISP